MVILLAILTAQVPEPLIWTITNLKHAELGQLLFSVDYNLFGVVTCLCLVYLHNYQKHSFPRFDLIINRQTENSDGAGPTLKQY